MAYFHLNQYFVSDVKVNVQFFTDNSKSISEYEFGISEYEFGISEYEFGISEYEFGISEYEFSLSEYGSILKKGLIQTDS